MGWGNVPCCEVSHNKQDVIRKRDNFCDWFLNINKHDCVEHDSLMTCNVNIDTGVNIFHQNQTYAPCRVRPITVKS